MTPGPLGAIADHVRDHKQGMVFDLLFAVVWVTIVSLLFEAVDGPRWAYYLLLFAGVPAYYGFVTSLDAARAAE